MCEPLLPSQRESLMLTDTPVLPLGEVGLSAVPGLL